MLISEIEISAFRNLQKVQLSPCRSINYFCGGNGQGKTNLLEAIWIFTGARSFRGAREIDMIPFGSTGFGISMRFDAFGSNLETVIKRDKKSRVVLKNGVEMPSLMSLAGNFCAVAFSPAHMSLVSGAPSERRKLADTAIGQIKPRYLSLLAQYTRILMQRNSLLASGSRRFSQEQMDIWDEPLAEIGHRLVKTRKSYVERLGKSAGEWYARLSQNNERLGLCYIASDGEIDGREGFLAALHRYRETDIKRGFTAVGPHRDDFLIKLDEKPAKSFGSQGQIRTAVLALKMAECTIMQETLGESPVVLLDDVLSELDKNRRDCLLEHLEGRQCFLTGCDAATIGDASSVYRVSSGRISKMA